MGPIPAYSKQKILNPGYPSVKNPLHPSTRRRPVFKHRLILRFPPRETDKHTRRRSRDRDLRYTTSLRPSRDTCPVPSHRIVSPFRELAASSRRLYICRSLRLTRIAFGTLALALCSNTKLCMISEHLFSPCCLLSYTRGTYLSITRLVFSIPLAVA